MPLSLIVNADDFGITEGVNNSIIACFRSGGITSATLMANMAAAKHAAILAAQTPHLGVGLHFNLTLGLPVAEPESVRSLVDSRGVFYPRSQLIARIFLGRVRRSDLKRELLAQFERMQDLGLDPSHFDSHQHIHAMPLIFSVISELAVRLSKPLRIPWKWRGKVSGKPAMRQFNEFALQAMVSRCMANMPVGMKFNDGLCSVFDLQRHVSSLAESDYLELLSPYKSGFIELMVHPGVVNDELRGKTEISEISALEDTLFRSDFIRAYVEESGGRCVSYREVN